MNIIKQEVGEWTHVFGVVPAYDNRDKGGGRCGAKMWFGVYDYDGGVTVDWITPFQLPEARDKTVPTADMIGSVSIHLMRPSIPGKEGRCQFLPTGECEDGGGSYLAADDAYDALTTGGLDALWTWLKEFYESETNHE